MNDGIRAELIETRKAQGIGVLEISRRTGIPKGTLYNYEYGRRNLGQDKLEAYAKALGCTIDVRLVPLKT